MSQQDAFPSLDGPLAVDVAQRSLQPVVEVDTVCRPPDVGLDLVRGLLCRTDLSVLITCYSRPTRYASQSNAATGIRPATMAGGHGLGDRKSTRLNSSH